MKFQALSELNVYKFAFSTIAGIVFLLTSGVILSKNKRTSSVLKLRDGGLLLVLVVSIVSVVQFSAYKIAVSMQPNSAMHAMIAQSIAYGVFLLVAFKYLKKDFEAGLITVRDFATVGILIYVFTVFESILFKELPLTILILLVVLQLLIYAVYDVKKKELKLNWQVYAAALLTATALVLINF